MEPEQLKEMLAAIASIADSVTKLGEKCDMVSAKCDALAKKKSDGEDDDMAALTAADSSRVTRREFEATQAQLRALQTSQPRRRSDASRRRCAPRPGDGRAA